MEGAPGRGRGAPDAGDKFRVVDKGVAVVLVQRAHAVVAEPLGGRGGLALCQSRRAESSPICAFSAPRERGSGGDSRGYGG